MKPKGLFYILWTFVSIIQFSGSLGKAHPSVVSSTIQYFESLCNNEMNRERFVESDGRRSSFFLELRSNPVMKKTYCERNFTTTETHGFIIRLIIAKNKSNRITTSSSSNVSNINYNIMVNGQRNHNKLMTFKNLADNKHIVNKYYDNDGNSYLNKNPFNLTSNCPLIIYSNNENNFEEKLWQIDPCELERDNIEYNENNWPVKFFEGSIRVYWKHNENSVHSKLMITTLGKGEETCNNESKFSCLEFSGAALFCISKDLICDNIRHCPNGNLYGNDEDRKMCEKVNTSLIKRPPTVIFDNDWEQQLILWMQHAFGDTLPQPPSISSHGFSEIADVLLKEYHDGRPESSPDNNNPFLKDENEFQRNHNDRTKSPATITTTKKNSLKNSLTRDLSKYGPWGYLMLGMLLCGGALLICGLWECCCRSNKNQSHVTGSTIVGNGTSIHETIETQSSHNQINITPPNYDELDSPPAYSVLFPYQKGTSISLTQPSSPPPLHPAAIGIEYDSMVRVPVVVVIPGGARSNHNINNNNNNHNANNNNNYNNNNNRNNNR